MRGVVVYLFLFLLLVSSAQGQLFETLEQLPTPEQFQQQFNLVQYLQTADGISAAKLVFGLLLFLFLYEIIKLARRGAGIFNDLSKQHAAVMALVFSLITTASVSGELILLIVNSMGPLYITVALFYLFWALPVTDTRMVLFFKTLGTLFVLNFVLELKAQTFGGEFFWLDSLLFDHSLTTSFDYPITMLKLLVFFYIFKMIFLNIWPEKTIRERKPKDVPETENLGRIEV